MNLAQLLTLEQIVPEMVSTEHEPAIEELVEHLVSKQRVPQGAKATIVEKLLNREEQTSTGIGSGVAIPHTFVDTVSEVTAVFGRSPSGIEFGALDHAPVHFVILFIVPRAQYHLHLRTLAAIAKLFNSTDVRTALMEAKEPQEILDILSRRPART